MVLMPSRQLALLEQSLVLGGLFSSDPDYQDCHLAHSDLLLIRPRVEGNSPGERLQDLTRPAVIGPAQRQHLIPDQPGNLPVRIKAPMTGFCPDVFESVQRTTRLGGLLSDYRYVPTVA